MIPRRTLLKSLGLLAFLPGAYRPGSARAATGAGLVPVSGFDFAWLKGKARALAGDKPMPVLAALPDAIAHLDWDAFQSIRYRNDRALWHDRRLHFDVKFFHVGLFYRDPVRIFEVVAGRATEWAYDPALFDFGKSGLDPSRLRKGLGFSGFRIDYHTDPSRDVAAFLGASYFRAVGETLQYGLSSRGLAIDCGMDKPEEFPNFTTFWFERPASGSGRMTVYALMESPSITGAYRFDITPGATLVMDVDAALYPRKEIERIGIAPLTSMFFCGPHSHRIDNDWRSAIHDSDGLALWTGSGEWIWRPLSNPVNRQFNAFQDDGPRGFGLLQRDRNFDHYQDDGAYYERRPSLWVEPKSSWGKGAIHLVELPTEDETSDNIVAYWHPARPPKPGEELLFGYRLYWGSAMPVTPPLAQVVATRAGVGGVVGQKHEHPSRRFVVDFAGGNLPMLGKDARVDAVITASAGTVEQVSARLLGPTGGYRATFDLVPGKATTAPINLRLFLRSDGEALSETWNYQWALEGGRDLG